MNFIEFLPLELQLKILFFINNPFDAANYIECLPHLKSRVCLISDNNSSSFDLDVRRLKLTNLKASKFTMDETLSPFDFIFFDISSLNSCDIIHTFKKPLKCYFIIHDLEVSGFNLGDDTNKPLDNLIKSMENDNSVFFIYNNRLVSLFNETEVSTNKIILKNNSTVRLNLFSSKSKFENLTMENINHLHFLSNSKDIIDNFNFENVTTSLFLKNVDAGYSGFNFNSTVFSTSLNILLIETLTNFENINLPNLSGLILSFVSNNQESMYLQNINLPKLDEFQLGFSSDNLIINNLNINPDLNSLSLINLSDNNDLVLDFDFCDILENVRTVTLERISLKFFQRLGDLSNIENFIILTNELDIFPQNLKILPNLKTLLVRFLTPRTESVNILNIELPSLFSLSITNLDSHQFQLNMPVMNYPILKVGENLSNLDLLKLDGLFLDFGQNIEFQNLISLRLYNCFDYNPEMNSFFNRTTINFKKPEKLSVFEVQMNSGINDLIFKDLSWEKRNPSYLIKGYKYILFG